MAQEVTGHNQGGVVHISTEPDPQIQDPGIKEVITVHKPISRPEGPIPQGKVYLQPRKGKSLGKLT